MVLSDIIGGLIYENAETECKSILDRSDVVGWLKSVAGFANAAGGTLYVGVEDKTNKLIGFDMKAADNERNFFNNQVNEHLIPHPQMSITFLPYKVKNSERYIIKIEIPESAVKPVILKYKNIPSIFMRRDGFTNGATYEEIIDMSVKSKGTQYDVLVTDEKYFKEDFSELFEYYKGHNDGKELTEKKLRSMGFMDENGYLTNGAVLFKNNYSDSKTAIQCSAFAGINKGSERIVTLNRFNGNLIKGIENIMDFVTLRMNHTIIKKDDSRVNIDAYPRRALFEGVINAIAHRDYYLDGTQIQVDMFKDRLEISSPGSFYRGEKIGKTYDLSGIISKRRNEIISSVLVACNVMEAAGSGFDKITEEYLDADEAHKPFIYSSSDHFTLVLPDLTYGDGVESEDYVEVVYVAIPNESEHDRRILSFCYNRPHKSAEIANYLGISDSTYFRKKVLDNLVQNGYLIKENISRAAYFRTNKEKVEQA